MLFAEAIALTELPKRPAMPYKVSPDWTTYVVPDVASVALWGADGAVLVPVNDEALPGITSSWPM
jgi:hypothetical protein